MAMTIEEKRAYSRGYCRGNRWPEHRPPVPPEEHVAALMTAARRLADAVDGQLAMLLEDDPWQESLGVPLNGLNAAMSQITEWLRDKNESVV